MKHVLMLAIGLGLAGAAHATAGPDVDVAHPVVPTGNALTGVEISAGWFRTGGTRIKEDETMVRTAGSTARGIYEAAADENAKEMTALREYANTVTNKQTNKLIQAGLSLREAIGDNLKAWLSDATDMEGTRAITVNNETRYVTGSGRPLRASTAALREASGAITKNANDLTSKLNSTLSELNSVSSVGGIESAAEKLARGQAATGSMLLMPGEKKGEERIAITSGVVDRATADTGYETRIRSIGSGEAGILEKPTGGEGENASLVMIGDNVHATVGAGEAAILIGDNSSTTGNGIAIGKDTASTNNSIALGNGSVSTEPDELSIGNENGLTRKITHMADGTNDSDGATIHNLKSEISRLDTIALDYADTKKEQAITMANEYTNTAKAAAIDVANKHTDREITTLDTQAQGYATAAKSEAVNDANQYSDDTAKKTLKSANDYTERRAVVAENNAVTRSNAYTDESSSRTLEKANTYTNHQVAQAENNAVTRSNDYTNKRFGELKHQVDRNEKRANGGIAGAMAMTAIPSVPGHNFSFGMAASGYRDQGAVAAGVKANITQDTTVSLNTAWDSGNGVGVAAGFSVGW
ncbi:YadA-like family protein [Salmonella enterica]|nr:YadA-like family protein [Salmonella enterica]EBA1913714.1 hypothetical protein [Salmonella enterica]PUF07379.1 hypothetical protein DA813_16005 [Salmonella enterica subsp. enterica]PUO44881.1 hypothetical protein DAY10_14355 [Salmonella enterica subsp. enterica]PUO63961.1 hypothetical protein DAX55_17585 [Salmonella enterica subsp. enterica]PUQ15334.1 hypothetical protein DAX99_15815 [Salmonella enterica subsp. enterica]